jgi:hypothetical protein
MNPLLPALGQAGPIALTPPCHQFKVMANSVKLYWHLWELF